MKRFIVKIYRMMYQATGARMFSFIFAILYISALNLVTVYGLSLLLEDLFAPAAIVQRLFSFPLLLVTCLGTITVHFILAPSMQHIAIERDRQKRPNYTPVILYTAISVIIFMYTHFSDKLF